MKQQEAYLQMPMYRSIFKDIIKHQIQCLIDQLANVGEESVLLTGCLTENVTSDEDIVGSEVGRHFIRNKTDIQTSFYQHCQSYVKYPKPEPTTEDVYQSTPVKRKLSEVSADDTADISVDNGQSPPLSEMSKRSRLLPLAPVIKVEPHSEVETGQDLKSPADTGSGLYSGISHETTADIYKAPEAVCRGNFKAVPFRGEPTIITLDLESTGLIENRVMPQIIQIAATEISSVKSFNCYVVPTIPISPEASKVNGITYSNNKMRVKHQLVPSVQIREAVSQFLSWLQQFENVIMCSHDGRRFDFPILLSSLKKLDKFSQFSDQVCGLVDTMSIFRKLFPKSSLNQFDLAKMLLQKTDDVQNAMCNVVTLGELILHVNLNEEELYQHTFSPSAVLENLAYNKAKSANLPSLEVLVFSGVCKRPTAENVAGSGLNLQDLRLIYQNHGQDGLYDIFTSKTSNGLPRVTNSKKVLEEFIPKLADFFSK